MSSNVDDVDKINGSPPKPPPPPPTASSLLPAASASSVDQIIQPWSLIDGEFLVADGISIFSVNQLIKFRIILVCFFSSF
jgi:hypothetical protein